MIGDMSLFINFPSQNLSCIDINVRLKRENIFFGSEIVINVFEEVQVEVLKIKKCVRNWKQNGNCKNTVYFRGSSPNSLVKKLKSQVMT